MINSVNKGDTEIATSNLSGGRVTDVSGQREWSSWRRDQR